MKNSMQEDVEWFMNACSQEVASHPQIPDEKTRNLRIRLMTEELLGSNQIDGYPDAKTPVRNPYHLIPDKSNELVQSMLNEDLVGIADGIADLLYVVFGTASAYGIDAQAVFDEAHKSNSSKAVWDEATKTYVVLKDEGGKVIKPDTYEPADFEAVITKKFEEYPPNPNPTKGFVVTTKKEKTDD